MIPVHILTHHIHLPVILPYTPTGSSQVAFTFKFYKGNTVRNCHSRNCGSIPAKVERICLHQSVHPALGPTQAQATTVRGEADHLISTQWQDSFTMIVLYCTVLYFNVLCCTVLYFNALYCTVLHCLVLYYNVTYCTVLYSTILYLPYSTVLYCIVFTIPYYTVLYCTVL